MSKIKIKKQLKKLKRQRKNEFGFPKTREIVEIEGSEKGYFLDSSPLITQQHKQIEEVVVVDTINKDSSEKPRFRQLSSIPISKLVKSSDQPLEMTEQDQEDLGFFFDSTPSKPTEKKEKSKPVQKNKKKEQKQKIIQDDSVYISMTDDDDEDGLSVSSSEDIEIIKSLAHWSRQDSMNQLEIDSFKKRRRRSLDAMDYHLLESMTIQDILEEEEAEAEIYSDLTDDLDFEQELKNVPSGLIQNYKGIIREEKNRYNQERRSYIQKKKKKNSTTTTILEDIIHGFIERKDIQSYNFKSITVHGRNIVIPKIAKLFQLKTIEELDTNSIKLEKTVNTCIPTSFKYYLNQQQQQQSQQPLKKKRSKPMTSYNQRQEEKHGKQVAVGSEPISSNNIGHRMLSAMGWKEGDTIGSKEDAIKEPIKVFMRANRRGLGA